jgi:CMP-N-acetylneuraminic acid synthetase
MTIGNDFVILLPARKNSKGFPLKNRKLFSKTADIIPHDLKKQTYVFTDDSVINKYAKSYGFNILKRNPCSAKDVSTTKDMMQDFAQYFSPNTIVVMLYLTYPERRWNDVESAISLFQQKNIKSLLCKKEVEQSPYLMMYELPGNLGEQVIEHNLCRRQEYRKCFELSHYMCILRLTELRKLNNNLYNSATYFMKTGNTKDIDYKEDWIRNEQQFSCIDPDGQIKT